MKRSSVWDSTPSSVWKKTWSRNVSLSSFFFHLRILITIQHFPAPGFPAQQKGCFCQGRLVSFLCHSCVVSLEFPLPCRCYCWVMLCDSLCLCCAHSSRALCLTEKEPQVLSIHSSISSSFQDHSATYLLKFTVTLCVDNELLNCTPALSFAVPLSLPNVCTRVAKPAGHRLRSQIIIQ